MTTRQEVLAIRSDSLIVRIIVTGDRHWRAPDFAKQIVSRLLPKYGPDIVIVRGGFPGIDYSVAEACRELGVQSDLYLADFSRVGDFQHQNREMLRKGAGLCIIVHRGALNEQSKDLARQPTKANVPTYLIENEEGIPKRMLADNIRLQ